MVNKYSVLTVVGFLLLSCHNPASPNRAEGSILIRVFDSPASFDAISLALHKVEARRAGPDSILGWAVLQGGGVITFDLLTLRNGINYPVAQTSLAASHYSGLRLLFGPTSYVRVNGVQQPLTIPAFMVNGFELSYSFDIVEGVQEELALDFDALRSIRQPAANQYELDPVIRPQSMDVAGRISGAVFQVNSQAIISTKVNADSVTTFADTTNGSFQLVALPEGTYDVTILPQNLLYRDTTLVGIAVQRQQNSILGVITLNAR